MPSSGRDPAQQHVIQPAKHSRLLQRHQIARLLDDAEQTSIALRIAADHALVGLRQIITRLAVADIFLYVADRVGQAQGFGFVDPQDVIGEPLGRFAADAGQLGELVDQSADGFGDQRHNALQTRSRQFVLTPLRSSLFGLGEPRCARQGRLLAVADFAKSRRLLTDRLVRHQIIHGGRFMPPVSSLIASPCSSLALARA